MEQPLVTAVVLAYNAGPYLFPCLQSVAAQTWPCLLYTSDAADE